MGAKASQSAPVSLIKSQKGLKAVSAFMKDLLWQGLRSPMHGLASRWANKVMAQQLSHFGNMKKHRLRMPECMPDRMQEYMQDRMRIYAR